MEERSQVLELLASGVPLSLLMDLALPEGPDSEWIALVEGTEIPMASAVSAAS